MGRSKIAVWGIDRRMEIDVQELMFLCK